MTIEYQSVIKKIQPVVLVGGRSSRFGRDKLVESLGGDLLVSRPINALRSVFGDRIAIVGKCDQQVIKAADQVIEDPYPGLGPVGGICAALESTQSDIFVCAGDLVSIDAEMVWTIVRASIKAPDALAYIAYDGRRHPTVALYRSACISFFERAIAVEKLKLGSVLDQDSVHYVQVDPSSLRNINRPEELIE